MDTAQDETPLTERKVVRRGLIAGLAGLGAAAMLKVTGKAEAADGGPLVMGSTANVSTLQTQWNLSTATPGLQLLRNGITAGSVNCVVQIRAENVIGLYADTASGAGALRGSNSAGPGVWADSQTTEGVIGYGFTNANGVKGVSNSDFSSSQQGTGSGIGVLGRSGSGRGVQGDATSGTGVRGFSSVTGLSPLGDGAGTGVHGLSGTGIGVLGEVNVAPGVNVVTTAIKGVSGVNTTGVKGVSNTGNDLAGEGSGSGVGVQGLSNGIGVQGVSLDGRGVQGRSFSSFAVEGLALNVSGIGMRGANTQNGTGIKGVSNTGGSQAADGTGSGIGVHGKSNGGAGVRGESVNAAGVFGTSVNQPGVDGTSTNSLGIRGTSTNFVGIVGISTNGHGLYGSSNGGAAAYGIVAENLGANGPGLLVTGSTPSQIFGGLQVFGPKNAVLKMRDGSHASVYCQESPEPYFEDFGRAQLAVGTATVPLEREFAQLVAGGDYHVFLTPEGFCGNLCVTRRTPSGFEVREGGNGMTNVSFSYRIVTKRKDIEGKRFDRVSIEAAQSVASARAALTASAPVVSTPVPPAPQPFVPPIAGPSQPPVNPVAPLPAPQTPPGLPPANTR